MFKKFNKGSSYVREGINTRDQEFCPLSNFIGQVIHVDGFFFTNGDYGKQVVVVGEGFNINMPARALEQFEAIKDDPEALKAVLAGKLIINEIKAGKSKAGKDTTFYNLDDAE